MGFNRDLLRFICSMQFFRMAVLWTMSLIISYLQLFLNCLSHKTSSYPRRSPNESTKPICIITGASSGLGASAARHLSREGYYVILVGRSPYMLSKIIQEIKQQQLDAKLKAFEVDLSSMKSILRFKSSFEHWILESDLHLSVQLLINNAGILAASSRLTAEGHDQMMATNYIGAFAFTNVLLPLLRNSSSPSRIVNVTSFTHRCVSNVQVAEDILSGSYLKGVSRSVSYPLAHIYEYSKFCLVSFSYELHRRLHLSDQSNKISVMAADPGAVETCIMRELPPSISQFAFSVLRCMGLLKSPGRGIDSIIDAALAPPEASGLYFFGGKGRTLKSSALSYDAKHAEKLWSLSSKLLRNIQLEEKKCGH